MQYLQYCEDSATKHYIALKKWLLAILQCVLHKLVWWFDVSRKRESGSQPEADQDLKELICSQSILSLKLPLDLFFHLIRHLKQATPSNSNSNKLRKQTRYK